MTRAELWRQRLERRFARIHEMTNRPRLTNQFDAHALATEIKDELSRIHQDLD